MTMKEPNPLQPALTVHALQRMPYYLELLENALQEGRTSISSASIAAELGFSDVLIRKDLAAVSSTQGRPKTGFDVSTLIEDIRTFMGYHHEKKAVLVGAGSLGKALLRNAEFRKYGLHIVAAFDTRRSLIHRKIGDVEVYSLTNLKKYCLENQVRIGIITVPADAAQDVADRMAAGGILAIWNFALVKLHVPDPILVQNEDLASSLAMLSQHLQQILPDGPEEM